MDIDIDLIRKAHLRHERLKDVLDMLRKNREPESPDLLPVEEQCGKDNND
jgi:hypothetical protein